MAGSAFPDPHSGIQETLVDAKGDILTSTAADVPARLAVGANNYVLTADSDEATGLKWAAASSGLSAATQAEQETASSTSVAVTSGRQQFHPSAAKGWVFFTGTTPYTVGASYNVTSVTGTGSAQYTVNWNTDFSSNNYAYALTTHKLGTGGPGTDTLIVSNVFDQNAAYISFAVICINGTITEAPKIALIAYGDQ